MISEDKDRVEALQRVIAKTVATNPAGRNLPLIGGFRYRFLDESVRTSDDIDYHWSGDFGEKQKELLALFERKLLPEVRRRLRYACSAGLRTGPDADSPTVRVVDLAFWQEGSSFGRIEIPVEITRIACADPVIVRTADGTIYSTVSNGDMIESKVIAIFNRMYLRHRDLVDIFLFRDQFLPNSDRRLAAKWRTMDIPASAVDQRMDDLRKNKAYHACAVQEVIDTQLDPAAANQIGDAGGGKMIVEDVLKVLASLLPQGSSIHKSNSGKGTGDESA
jgi:hypothetical protein